MELDLELDLNLDLTLAYEIIIINQSKREVCFCFPCLGHFFISFALPLSLSCRFLSIHTILYIAISSAFWSAFLFLLQPCLTLNSTSKKGRKKEEEESVRVSAVVRRHHIAGVKVSKRKSSAASVLFLSLSSHLFIAGGVDSNLA